MNQKKDMKNFNKKRQEALSWLYQNFPQSFSRSNFYPLKVGISDDIFALSVDDKPANRWLRTALSYYTQSRYYLLAMRVDTPRLDLNGNAAGVVTQEQEDLAKAQLKAYPHQNKILKNKPLVVEKEEAAAAEEKEAPLNHGEPKRKILSLKKPKLNPVV